MVTGEMVERAVQALLEATPCGTQVILFGSRARGEGQPDSDLDFLVIEPEVGDRFGEMVRLSRLLGEMLVPADVVVMDREMFERFRDTPNTLANRAWKEGRFYDAAA